MYYGKKTLIGKQYKLNYLKGLAREDTFKYGSTRIEEGAAKIREDILNLLDISKGELFFDPEVGSNLDNYLFEANTFVLRDLITKCVTTDVEQAIPEVKMRYVQVDQNFDFHTVTITLEYDIISLGVTDTIEITRYIREKIDLG